jgi:short-subunit dehydrogenase
VELQGANVLLTGGSRGIGPSIARALLSRGARLTLAARSAEDLEEAATGLDTARVALAPGDVSVEADRARMVETAEEAFGSIDVLVNNAAVEWVRHFTDYTEEQVHSMVSVNLEGAIQLCRLVVPRMVDRARGQVVNVASLAGKAPVAWNVVYSATKHGLVGFSLALRDELRGSGVGVSVICPGYVVDAGLFAEHHVYREKPSVGTGTTSRKVAAGVVRAIVEDRPEVIVSGFLPRLSDVSYAISPTLSSALARRLDGFGPLRREADARRERGE